MVAPENPLRVGVLWRGNASRPPPAPGETRLTAVFGALAGQGADAVQVVFDDSRAELIRTELLSLDGLLVWVDPIMEGVNRTVLDGVLSDVAARGIWVSARPDVILKLGTKKVLYDTRAMTWGTDVRVYQAADEFRDLFSASLDSGVRVLKQHRGNGGNGVWRVEWAKPGRSVHLLHGLRGSSVEELQLEEFWARLAPFFASGSILIDQPYQHRLLEGMIRCYLAEDRVVGFGQQMVTALLAAAEPGARPAEAPARLYYGPDTPEFQDVRRRMEADWVPGLLQTLDLKADELPAIWDVDLLHGEPSSNGTPRYVLCEINVSSVFPIPDESVVPLAATAVRRTKEAQARRPSDQHDRPS